MPPKKIITKIRPWHVLLGSFSSGVILVAMVWILAPSLLDWGIRHLAAEAETEKFDMEVTRLDPWETGIENILIETKEADLSLGNLLLQYEPGGLATGEVNSFTLRNLNLKLDGKAVLDRMLAEQSRETDTESTLWLEQLGEYLSNPKLKTFRMFNAKTVWEWPDFSLPLKFKIKGDYNEGLASTIFDGEFAQFPFLSELHFWQEDGSTYGEVEIKFPDLNKSELLKYPFSRFTGLDFANEFKVESGDLVMQGIGRIDGNRFVDLFVEFNGSNIAGELLEFPFEIEKIISFVTPKNSSDVETRTYANISVEDFLDVKGLALGAEINDEIVTLRPSFQELRAADNFGNVKVSGLSLPVVDLNLSDLEDFSLKGSHDIFFDKLEIEEQGLSIYDGKLSVFADTDLDLFRVQVLPLNAILTDIGIRLFGLSFNGLGNISNPLAGEMNQVLSCDRALVGEDSLVEDLSLTFRPHGTKKVVIDGLTAKLKGVFTDFNPANCSVSLLDETEGGYRVDFNDSDIRLGNNKIVLEGLTGSIAVKSFDPLLTVPENNLSFTKFSNDQFTLEDGNFSLAVNEEGEFLISDFSVRIFGGSLEVDLAKWKMYTDLIKVEAKLTEVSGQQMIDFFEGLDVQIDGNFSGMVSFSNYDGAWDFGTGFLQLNPSVNANIKFNQGELIYGGVDPTDPQSKNLKLTSWALEDLEVDGMGINFKVLENDRQIIMSINGSRETKEQRVDLDYNPRFLGGLQDLLKWKENMLFP